MARDDGVNHRSSIAFNVKQYVPTFRASEGGSGVRGGSMADERNWNARTSELKKSNGGHGRMRWDWVNEIDWISQTKAAKGAEPGRQMRG